MSQSAYVVVWECGEFSDYRMKVLFSHSTREDAEAHVRALNQSESLEKPKPIKGGDGNWYDDAYVPWHSVVEVPLNHPFAALANRGENP